MPILSFWQQWWKKLAQKSSGANLVEGAYSQHTNILKILNVESIGTFYGRTPAAPPGIHQWYGSIVMCGIVFLFYLISIY